MSHQQHMTAAEYREHMAKQSRHSKYQNVKTECDGILFDSKAKMGR